MTLKDLLKYIFENYYKEVSFTEKDNYYSLKQQKIKNKDKKSHKTIKTVKSPNNGDIKYVTVN